MGFELKYIPHLGEVLLGFEIFYNCNLPKKEVYLTVNTKCNLGWAYKVKESHLGLLLKVEKRKHKDPRWL